MRLYVALTRKQFAVLEALVAAEGGVVSAEELLERAWDENTDPFTNAVRITPPLNISAPLVEEGLHIFEEALTEVEQMHLQQ